MNETRSSFASLTGSLLARKGGAKPAMRPRPLSTGQMLDDLGWDDMGDADDRPTEHVPSSIAGLTPAPKLAIPVREEIPVQPEPARQVERPAPVQAQAEQVSQPEPAPVHVQQRALAETFGPGDTNTAPVLSEAVVSALRTPEAKGRKSATAARVGGKKAAFTLRLDGDRHLKLRLASAITGKSSQLLVTAALDTFLETLPELGALARHMPARAGSGN